MPQFTPGPWQVQQLNHAEQELWLQIGYRDNDGSSRGPICRINCPAEPMPTGVVAEIKYMATSNENQLANARLIAAAPNLLRELRWCVDEFERLAKGDYECERCGYVPDEEMPEDLQRIKALLATVEGE